MELGYFLLGLLPIIWLIAALCILKMEAYKASLGALIIAFAEALTIWHMPAWHAFTAALEGFAMALWPIVLVIIAAVFTYNVTVASKGMDVIKQMISTISHDKRILVILIGWCFGGFLEGVAGFGTAIAIPASMLFAIGFSPIEAILVCLIANACPTMFGSIGIPTITLASVTQLDSAVLAFAQTLQAAPLLFVTPFLMVMVVSHGIKGLKGLVPLITVSSLSFLLPEIVVARFVGAELPVVVAGVCSLACTFLYARHYSKHHKTPTVYQMDMKESLHPEPISLTRALQAWSPFILIFFVLLSTSKLVMPVYQALNQFRSVVNIYQGDPQAVLTFTWIATPGVLILICGIIGGLIQGCTPADLVRVMGQTLKQMAKTIITMLGVLGCAKIMGYSGMIASIAAFFVSTFGSLYPLVAPLIGALGTFVTGSGTSSEVLFGNVQIEAAKAIGADPIWLAAANSLGTSAGKMLSPQSIAIGTAACATTGQDGEILKRAAVYAAGFVVVMAIIVYVGAPLWTWIAQ